MTTHTNARGTALPFVGTWRSLRDGRGDGITYIEGDIARGTPRR